MRSAASGIVGGLDGGKWLVGQGADQIGRIAVRRR